MAAQLRQADEASRTIDSTLPSHLQREKEAVDSLFEALRTADAGARPASPGLVEIGMRLLSNWFK
jgi:DNA mismatch repair protein MutH